MIELKTGEVYTAARTRSGESAKGAWQFAAVKEVGKNGKDGRKEILVWVSNKPVNISDGGKFRIASIHSVKFASKKDNAGVWHDEVNIEADITPVMNINEAKDSGLDVSTCTFEDLSDDGELPF
jgi:hypothetical protein